MEPEAEHNREAPRRLVERGLDQLVEGLPRHVERRPEPRVLPGRPVDYSLGSLLAAFGYAFQGIWYLLRTQRNAQIHCLIGACAVALGAALRISRMEWLALVLIITVVLAAEGVNTAVEATVDLSTSARHPLAKIAKDVAAGTVLLCAIAAVVVGCIIFLPHLIPLLTGLL